MLQTSSDLPNETCFSSGLTACVERWSDIAQRYVHRFSPPLRRYPIGRSRSLSGEQFRPETLLIPVVFATKLGNVLPSTTVFELLRQAVCRLSNVSHSSSLIASDPSPLELCDAPEVVRNFATVTAIMGVIGGITSMIGCGVLSRISPRYGRKPVFLFILIMEIAWSCLIPSSQLMPGKLADWFLLFAILFEAFARSLPYGYLVNMYIVDVSVPEDRTATLSKIGGWGALGACIPLALGGVITTSTGNPFIVCYVATAIFVSTFIYAASVLPETFPEDKRNALSRVRMEQSRTFATSRFASILSIFEPLKMLLPTGTSSKTRNDRLIWLAAHSFVFVTAHPHTSSAWLVFVTSKFHLTPADNGVFFTTATVSGMVVLTVVIPPLVRILRPYYSRQTMYSPLVDEGFIDIEQSEVETLNRLDVHLVFASCIIAAIFFLCAVASPTKLALIVSAVFVGLMTMHTPSIRSLIAGSVDPLKQEDAMAAIEIVDGGSKVFAPIIMSSILTATVDTAPQLLFYVHLVIVLISAGLLLRVS